MIQRALISVSDKTGIVEFASELQKLGVSIISTGGTAKALNEAGIETVRVQDVTGFPECLDGRVKTLHPKIHGGLLARRDVPEHMDQMKEFGVEMIDLVIINLYPFKQTISKEGVLPEEDIENIDIGGPSMLRSAAKNHRDVVVLVDPVDYEGVLAALKSGSGEVSLEQKRQLARKVFEHTANYDAMIAEYFLQTFPVPTPAADPFSDKLTLTFELAQKMRYGENPHQAAAFYREPIPAVGSLATFEQLHGKELSYNNIGDLDGALDVLREFDRPTVVAVKHANPCGVGSAEDIFTAYEKAYDSDPVSIFGGIVVANRKIDGRTAEKINSIFLEIIAAPDYEPEALEILTRKKNIRVLKLDTGKAAENYRLLGTAKAGVHLRDLYVKKVGGGLLVQTADAVVQDQKTLHYVTNQKPDERQLADLEFAMAVVKHTKSNAIVLARDLATVGVGPGQTSRIMATKIAVELAGEKGCGAVAASDAFFPFADCVEAMAAAGVKAIIQPGGSQNDQESVDACNKHGIAMVFTGIRHFKH